MLGLVFLGPDYLNAPPNTVERARYLMEYLMVGLYVYFPPVRAGPIRELAIGESLLQVNGKWHLDLRKYKTYKIYGPVVSELHTDLIDPVNSYLETYRSMLLNKENTHNHVFVNRSGLPFSSSAWSSALQSIFRRKTGQMISANLLRDSFVTYVYSQDVGESMKESIALHMGHRVDTAKQVYDRRTSTERRMAGVAYASNLVQQFRDKGVRNAKKIVVAAEESESEEELEEPEHELMEESEQELTEELEQEFVIEREEEQEQEQELGGEQEQELVEPDLPLKSQSNDVEIERERSDTQARPTKRRRTARTEYSSREYYWAGVDMLP